MNINLRQIATDAARLRELHERIHAGFGVGEGAAHHAACLALHSNFDRLAFPGGLRQGLQQLKQHDPTALEAAVRFLEADPYFFRSGYIKEQLLQTLKRSPLTDDQQTRLAHCILRSVFGGPRRVFAAYARLAAVVHPPDLLVSLETQQHAENPEIRRRAAHVLTVQGSRAVEHHP